jgi:hypothetical protein
MRIPFVIIRIVVAAAIATAIIVQLVGSIVFWLARGDQNLPFEIVDFFSFFSIDAAGCCLIVLLIGAVIGVVRRTDPRWFTVLRASAVSYTIAIGILYNLLERGAGVPAGVVPWSNNVVHVAAPLYVILDWLFAPGRTPLAWRRIWVVLSLPVAWSVYTLVRGPLAIDAYDGKPWYPYSFLDPASSSWGYLSVVLFLLLFAGVIALLAAGAIWVSRRRLPRKPSLPS